MKRISLLITLALLSQFTLAQDKGTPKLQKTEGCIYGDVVYAVGEKHRVQQSVTDPVTREIKMVDLEPAIVQECMENTDADKTKLPRFYWRTLPAKQ